MSDFAYIGREQCGHVTFAVVENPEHQKDMFSEINKAVRSGLKIERVTVDEARAELTAWDTAKFEHDRQGVCKEKRDERQQAMPLADRGEA